ncbi:hypothetical protein A2380_00915 [candidate division WWE3 bacterium RIFOXYB1_FULL_43_24]|uniref:Uncharacterized protein n=1 Tax=candidate division WWE3 bacterium GW2011_GWF1_42_14 TaxID=1619138 RepID=A0A0G0YRP7_UNCKA|nr:MAG: hypothetical protein UU92_C0005G0101 [candidate division WWE3 bacterium GW2011_GWA1_42_12]KKS34155.1 MAG: hypothetical protein UU97_C0014G0006 [candidate division WWE3 bacterium GW2011_GWD1_42_14]KKS39269.1 MAG: hypothetical protein UV00_C0003G0101 [candidate division WWE3 bacterium GW2011_GWF1_42_14]KKS40767.1 MAG: hypothetical protein UV03_C0003G0080 [candidate division WWE3 bacterium GW2011_GWE1_42_16]OGC69497.1 MAG: hypothetical protein A2380_00915 [candidate division WWE3 bacterium
MENEIENADPEFYTVGDLFTADKEIVDSLKLEYSSATPFEENLVRDTFNIVRDEMLNKYGDYIPDDARERLLSNKDNINGTNHVLILSEEDYQSFNDEWLPKLQQLNKQEQLPPLQPGGMWLRMGQVIVVCDMTEVAKRNWESSKKYFENYGQIDEEAMINFIKNSTVTALLTHETIHSCQGSIEHMDRGRDMYIRVALDECGVHYLCDEILKTKFPRMVSAPQQFDKERIEKFQDILKKYGDDAYGVLFQNVPKGVAEKEHYESLKKKIYSEFTEEDIVRLGIADRLTSKFFENAS